MKPELFKLVLGDDHDKLLNVIMWCMRLNLKRTSRYNLLGPLKEGKGEFAPHSLLDGHTASLTDNGESCSDCLPLHQDGGGVPDTEKDPIGDSDSGLASKILGCVDSRATLDIDKKQELFLNNLSLVQNED